MPVPDTPLRPATVDELEQALAHALRFTGRKQYKGATEFMAQIAATHLVEQLRLSGFVVMKKPPAEGAAALARPSPHLTDWRG